jgi:hypothetical protein
MLIHLFRGLFLEVYQKRGLSPKITMKKQPLTAVARASTRSAGLVSILVRTQPFEALPYKLEHPPR